MFQQFFKTAVLFWEDGEYLSSVMTLLAIISIPAMVVFAFTRPWDDDEDDSWPAKLHRYSWYTLIAGGGILLIIVVLKHFFDL